MAMEAAPSQTGDPGHLPQGQPERGEHEAYHRGTVLEQRGLDRGKCWRRLR